MPGLNIGYARVSTDQQDLTAQRDGLEALDVAAERIYVQGGGATPLVLLADDPEQPGYVRIRGPQRDGRCGGSAANRCTG